MLSHGTRATTFHPCDAFYNVPAQMCHRCGGNRGDVCNDFDVQVTLMIVMFVMFVMLFLVVIVIMTTVC